MKQAAPERRALAPGLSCVRLLNGMWQVSGAHGAIEPRAAIDAMIAYHDAGFTTWDLADHYGPAEDFIGEFRRRLARERGAAALAEVQACTKWVPRPQPISRELVERAVDRSLARMGADALDLLQFHWWEYGDPGYLDALRYLDDLRLAGKIRHLGLTNFDTERLREILDAGIPIVTNQVQYSLVDGRPAVRMAALCRERGVQLLAYGSLCGGLLTERFLRRREPGRAELDTVSLRKYRQMVDAWGGWELFQELLAALEHVAGRHSSSIAAVALRAVLDRPAVAGVIVGARLGLSQHIAANARAFELRLDAADLAEINAVLARGQDLFRLIGDCGDEYR